MICKIILLSILMIRLGVNLAWHNETRQVTYNFWWTLVSNIMFIGLFYGAGLFD